MTVLDSNGGVCACYANDPRAKFETLKWSPYETPTLGALAYAGRSSFSALQNRMPGGRLVYYVFDAMILGRNVTKQPLAGRRRLLRGRVQRNLSEP